MPVQMICLSQGKSGAGAGPTYATLTNPTNIALTSSNHVATKNAGGNSWNADAQSTQQCASGNCSIEWAVLNNADGKMVALSHDNPDSSYSGLDAAIYEASGVGGCYVYENGGVSFRIDSGGQVNGDLLKVAVQSGVFHYYYRSVDSGYSSSETVSYPLFVDMSIFTPSAVVGPVTIIGLV